MKDPLLAPALPQSETTLKLYYLWSSKLKYMWNKNKEGKLGNGLLISHREVAPGGEEGNKKRRQEEKNKTVKERILYGASRQCIPTHKSEGQVVFASSESV